MQFSTIKIALTLRIVSAAATLLVLYNSAMPAFAALSPAVGRPAVEQPAAAISLAPSPAFAAGQPEEQAPASANTYSGIGASLGIRDGRPIIVAPHEGGPAHRAGLRVDDVILKVDGQDVTTLPLSEIVSRIRGEVGVAVVVTVFRPETNETLDFSIIREEIDLTTLVYACKEPIRGFGLAWRNQPEARQRLGCPFTDFRQGEHATRAAVQSFEHGWMLWLETDTVANVDPIYVFFEDDHSYVRFDDRPLADAHAYAPTPDGFYKVGDRFAKTYWEELGEAGQTRLGRAVDEARDSQGAFQEFQNGRMFWAGQADTIYLIYQGYYDPDGDGQTTWQQGWLSYEDTFEDVKQ
jgi:hypothetical protein